jgi:hypothetical protein
MASEYLIKVLLKHETDMEGQKAQIGETLVLVFNHVYTLKLCPLMYLPHGRYLAVKMVKL